MEVRRPSIRIALVGTIALAFAAHAEKIDDDIAKEQL